MDRAPRLQLWGAGRRGETHAPLLQVTYGRHAVPLSFLTATHPWAPRAPPPLRATPPPPLPHPLQEGGDKAKAAKRRRPDSDDEYAAASSDDDDFYDRWAW